MREYKFRAWDKISKKMKPYEEFIQNMIINPYNHNFKIIGNIYENPELLEVVV